MFTAWSIPAFVQSGFTKRVWVPAFLQSRLVKRVSLPTFREAGMLHAEHTRFSKEQIIRLQPTPTIFTVPEGPATSTRSL